MKITGKFERREPAPRQAVPKPQDHVPSAPSPAARSLVLGHYIQRLVDQGVLPDFTAAARALGVSQPRITHLTALTLLPPGMQEAILLGNEKPSEKALRDLARAAQGGWSR